MSDFFEKKDGLEESEAPAEETKKYKDEFEGFDTIFSDPTEKRAATNKSGNKKRLTVVLASVLAVLVLVSGTLAIIKLIPKKDLDNNSSASNEISVLELNTDLLEKVTVKNENGKFVFTSERKKIESSESDSEEYETVWTLSGVKAELTDTYAISGTFSGISNISATREVTGLSLQDCGLDNPRFEVSVESEKYGNFSVLIGKASLDTMGTYLKLSTKDNIYLVTTDLTETLNFTALDLADVTDIDVIDVADEYLSEGTLKKFDKLTVSGKNFAKPVVIGMNEDDFIADFLPYLVKSPTERFADNLTTILSVFTSSVAADGAYSYDVSASALKKFGLNNPDMVISIEVAGESLTYRFAKVEDGVYAMSSTNCKMIKKVSLENAEFLEFATDDLYSTWVFLRPIDDTKDITFTLDGKDHKFELTHNPGEDAEDTSDDELIVSYKSKKIDTETFRDFYQEFISLRAKGFDTEKTNLSPELTVKVNYLEKYNRSEILTFTRVSATKYQYNLDGKALGNITAASYNKVIKALNKVIG
ncbi:MAG: DUF4340 domain-containing protein [Oscillospiraceae bacterium]|nr:DUF4340 domain-containing protein [Oscillospiraceae bacterium]